MNTLERLVEESLRERLRDPKLTIPRYIAQCELEGTADNTAAANLGVPLRTYQRWKKRHLVITKTVKIRQTTTIGSR